MKLLTYTSTPGLERFPKEGRFAVYRAAHKRLIREDAAYRRHWLSYVAGVICVALVPVGGIAAAEPLGVWLAAVSVLASGVGIVWLAQRQQTLMNKRIADALRTAIG